MSNTDAPSFVRIPHGEAPADHDWRRVFISRCGVEGHALKVGASGVTTGYLDSWLDGRWLKIRDC